MSCNEHLATVLEKLLQGQDEQEQWLQKDSGFDNSSKKMMSKLVGGQRACIDEFRNWVGTLDYELPIALVAEETTPGSWRLNWDGSTCDEMTETDQDMLDAMQYIVFNGDSCREGNEIIDRMLSFGLPEKLRDDVAGS
ncbi:MAG: hypothetical protein CMJ36_05670 [Phycisphaerae bacterium]|nr:hypothetical protein [Phycisphaerae bacterium]